MSRLKVNTIEPYSGTDLSLTGSLTTKGINGVTVDVGGQVSVKESAAPNLQSFLDSAYSGTVRFDNSSTSDSFGLAQDMNQWGFLGDWTGPGIFANDTGDNYPTIIGFQNKASWTDGRVTVLTPIVGKSGAYVTGSVESNLGNTAASSKVVSTSGDTTVFGGEVRVNEAGTPNVTSNLSSAYGGTIRIDNSTTQDSFGLAGDMNQWGFLGDWSGPGIFSNDPSSNYPTIIGFENSGSWTDGKVTFLTPMVSNVSLKLVAQDPLPSGELGMLAVSGSNLYFHNGSTWVQK